jgi:hypothetical protein
MTEALPLQAPAGPTAVGRGLLQLLELIASACAVVVGAVLAVVFAVSLLLMGLIGGALMAFAGLAWRARRSAVPVPVASGPQLLQARKVGHSWVAYGWERR